MQGHHNAFSGMFTALSYPFVEFVWGCSITQVCVASDLGQSDWYRPSVACKTILQLSFVESGAEAGTGTLHGQCLRYVRPQQSTPALAGKRLVSLLVSQVALLKDAFSCEQ